MSGQGRYRGMWEYYYQHVQAIIFVVDATDKKRIGVARDELDKLVDNPDVRRSKPLILIFVNKNDVQSDDVMQAQQVETVLRLSTTMAARSLKYHVVSSSARTNAGVAEGLRWLSEELSQAGESSRA